MPSSLIRAVRESPLPRKLNTNHKLIFEQILNDGPEMDGKKTCQMPEFFLA